MAKFNNTVKYNAETTYEGGKAYAKDIVEDWCNNLFSTYLEDSYYTSRQENIDRFIGLTEQVADKMGYEFVAKASNFARNTLGMRSISQLTAAWLSQHQFENKRAYYRAYPHRPDDVAEVMAAMKELGYKPNNSVNRGFGDYISNLNSYSLGKYKLNSREFNMYDVINITHANSPVINAYKRGELETPDTWETAISDASKSDVQRRDEWFRLVREHKLGYMALLRNLNNIIAAGASDDVEFLHDYLCPQLIDANAIKKSLVFPYRIYTAWKNMKAHDKYIDACLQRAFIMAVDNMPELSGKSAVILDVSGSMEDRISAKSSMTIKEVGAVYGASILLKNPDSPFIKFGNYAKAYTVHIEENNVFEVIKSMCYNDGCGYGTDVHVAFGALKESVDRIFLISDMQTMSKSSGWYYSSQDGSKTFEEYTRKYNPECDCYSFDLGNYHTQISSPKNRHIHLLTALNDEVYKFITLLESGESIVDYINNLEYC